MHRTLRNLVNNAVSYGTGRVTVDCSILSSQHALRVMVQNPKLMQGIAPLSNGAAKRGVGVGLDFCRWVLDAHESTLIHVEDEHCYTVSFDLELIDENSMLVHAGISGG
jgi:K+-sensing histidine kinase KdpD